MLLEFHHTGVIVDSIQNSLEIYSSIFGKENCSEVFEISSQGVSVCFVKVGLTSYLELVQSTSPNSLINNLKKKSINYYHIGYLVEEINETIEKLINQGFFKINEFFSEAFGGKKCAFLMSKEMHLIELIQK